MERPAVSERGAGALKLELSEKLEAGPVEKVDVLQGGPADPRKVIYMGAFTVMSGDVAHSLSATKEIAKAHGGYVQRMTSSTIVIRVPSEKFDQAVADLGKLGPIVNQEISAQDVTERFVDLQTRLKNSRALLEKLQELLGKAKDVKEALAVEQEMARVRMEIEKLETELNRLSNQVVFATLSVTFVPARNAPAELKTRLPFWWVHELGLENLLRF